MTTPDPSASESLDSPARFDSPDSSASPARSDAPAHFDSSDVVARLRAGDPQAWTEVTRRYERLLLWSARRYRLSHQDTQDAVQLTWLRCLEHLDQLEHADRLSAWLVTICARECIRLATRNVREQPIADLDDTVHHEGRQPTPVTCAATSGQLEDRLFDAWQARMLRQAVTTLPTRERLLVQLLLREDPPSYRQISRELGMPAGAIGPVRQRALRRLHAVLAGQFEVDRAAHRIAATASR